VWLTEEGESNARGALSSVIARWTMRLSTSFSLCIGATLLVPGCRQRDSAPEDRPKAASPAPDVAVAAEKSGFAARFDAASTIENISLKDEALGKLATDAASAGNREITNKAIDGIQNVSLHDDIAYTSALALAKAGKEAAALEVAKSINNVTKKDAVMAKIAKGDTNN
jgi:hypothetical protein